jgi:hypothetical protein
MTTTDEKTFRYIQRVVARFQKQLATTDGWPTSYVFPTPQNDDERAALRQFVAELERELGGSILFTTEPSHA